MMDAVSVGLPQERFRCDVNRLAFGMVILLAGFMSVDTSLRESALLDGANRFQIFVSVDIPQIRPVPRRHLPATARRRSPAGTQRSGGARRDTPSGPPPAGP